MVNPGGWHPKSRILELDGYPVHYVDTGDPGRPTVVFLHGILVSSWSWRFNIDAVSERYRVIAICQKGAGWSGRGGGPHGVQDLGGFVLHLLDALGIGPVHLVGNSLGGAVSLALALEQPARVQSLVLVNAAGVTIPLAAVGRLQSDRLAGLYRLLGTRRVFRQLLRRLAYANIDIDEGYMDHFMGPLERTGSLATPARIMRSLGSDLQRIHRRLDEIQQPALLIWGERDRLVPLRYGLALADGLPNARLEVFSHCAHCPMEEDPDRFNSQLLSFLAEHAAAAEPSSLGLTPASRADKTVLSKTRGTG